MMSRRPLLVAVCLLLLIALHAASGAAAPAATLEVSFLDVGQGDSILIRDLAGFDALVDGGKTSAGPAVVAYLRQQGVDSIEVVLATHADSDHIGGLVEVLRLNDIPVHSVLYNGYPGSTVTWTNFAGAVAAEGLTPQPAQHPQTYAFGPALAQVLNPSPGLPDPVAQNGASVVLRVSHGSVDFLLTGDIDADAESAIVQLGLPLEAEVLKVAHHGSAYSSSTNFLSAVAPKEAVISVGTNSYGHPSPETLARLADAGARVWRTDQAGTVVVTSNGTSYVVKPGKGGQYKIHIPLVVLSQ